MPRLDPDGVREIAADGLAGTATDGARQVEAIRRSFAFDPKTLEEHREEIAGLLAEWPEEFQLEGGGGWTFLDACLDRHGNHRGEHPAMEMPFALGIAVGLARRVFPRELWDALPGGMPFVQVGAVPPVVRQSAEAV